MAPPWIRHCSSRYDISCFMEFSTKFHILREAPGQRSHILVRCSPGIIPTAESQFLYPRGFHQVSHFRSCWRIVRHYTRFPVWVSCLENARSALFFNSSSLFLKIISHPFSFSFNNNFLWASGACLSHLFQQRWMDIIRTHFFKTFCSLTKRNSFPWRGENGLIFIVQSKSTKTRKKGQWQKTLWNFRDKFLSGPVGRI